MPSQQFSTKDRILGAAEELFAQHGFAGTSLREVTGRGTTYAVRVPVVVLAPASWRDRLRLGRPGTGHSAGHRNDRRDDGLGLRADQEGR